MAAAARPGILTAVILDRGKGRSVTEYRTIEVEETDAITVGINLMRQEGYRGGSGQCRNTER
jgi:hypothetical protein